jgi:WD40 repeat protein
MDWLKNLFGKKEPELPQPAPTPKSLPAPVETDREEPEIFEELEEQKDPEVPDFTEIGGSSVPGLTLRQVLRGHTGPINRIAWSPDGSYLASPSEDKTIRIWDTRSGACVRTLQGHKDIVNSVTWSPDSKMLASGRTSMIKLSIFGTPKLGNCSKYLRVTC